jgi:hypothetical protein
MHYKDEMNQIEVQSPKDCVWYILETSRCKIPGSNRKDSICSCTNGIMQEFCMWVTKFLKSSSNIDPKELAGVKLPGDFDLTNLDNLSYDDMTKLHSEIEDFLVDLK